MYRLANLYLALYAADAIVSMLDDASGRMLAPLRDGLALTVVLASIPAFWSMAFYPAIPRSVFLPLTLSVA